MHDKVLIVDFGSQVTQLIARRVREEKVYCEIVPFQKAEEAFREMKPKAVTRSPWLIQTGYFSPLRQTPSNKGVSSVIVTSARPNSR